VNAVYHGGKLPLVGWAGYAGGAGKRQQKSPWGSRPERGPCRSLFQYRPSDGGSGEHAFFLSEPRVFLTDGGLFTCHPSNKSETP
jgi:hypothetical protein